MFQIKLIYLIYNLIYNKMFNFFLKEEYICGFNYVTLSSD